ncbi:MAG: mechanosensitive ion channel family protein [Acidimicrobiales bacterium]
MRTIAAILERAQDVVDVDSLGDAIDTDGLTAWDWGTAGIIMAVAIVLSPIVRRIVVSVFERSGSDPLIANLVGRLSVYTTILVGLVYALEELGVAIGPVLGALGIAGIAVAFALQDILANFVGGVIIQLRRPFTTGDEISSGGHIGTVVSVDARSVMIRTLDGEIVHIPSSMVIKEPLVNYTAESQRRTTLMVGVAYDTDLTRAEEVLLEATTSVAGVRNRPAPQALVEQFGESSIDFAVRFWHDAHIGDMWKIRHEVATAVKRGLDDAAITIPFPQRVHWFGAESADRGDEADSP